jgi:TPP-dependent 2-oxoacid decarboxylase
LTNHNTHSSPTHAHSFHLINSDLTVTVGFIDPSTQAMTETTTPLDTYLGTSMIMYIGLPCAAYSHPISPNTLTISPNQKHHSTWSLHRHLLPTTQIPVKRAFPKQKTPHSLATRVNPLYLVDTARICSLASAGRKGRV